MRESAGGQRLEFYFRASNLAERWALPTFACLPCVAGRGRDNLSASMTLTTVKPETAEQTQEACRQAADVLDAGGLVAMPTETVYGVAASASSAKGVAALRAFKQRPTQPFTVHLSDPDAAGRYADVGSMVAQRLIRKTMPGPMTLILEVDEEQIAARAAALGLSADNIPDVYHQNTVGVRCPDDGIARRIAASTSGPLLASSANRKGERAPVDAEEVAEHAADEIDLIVDGGACRFARASTTVRLVTVDGVVRPEVLRAGVFDERYVQKLTRWTMLLVCSGNTCRSPMAEAMACQVLEQRTGIAVDALEAEGYVVESAGTFAADGAPATSEAVQAMERNGLDLSSHRSRPLTPEMLRNADVIYCMTDSHRATALEMAPAAEDRTFLLDDSGDIGDPFGTDLSGYLRSAELIRRQLFKRIGALQL